MITHVMDTRTVAVEDLETEIVDNAVEELLPKTYPFTSIDPEFHPTSCLILTILFITDL